MDLHVPLILVDKPIRASELMRVFVIQLLSLRSCTPISFMGMLKKAASGVLALLPNLRAHRLAALRGVRAHVREYAPRVKRAAALLDELF